MKKEILSISFILLLSTVTFQLCCEGLEKDDSAHWDKTYGGSLEETAFCVRQTTDGGYVAAGSTRSYGAGENDFWLIKTDAFGNVEWSRTYGGAGSEVAFYVDQTRDEGYILAGYTYSFGAGEADFWLVKVDECGNTLWNRTYGGASGDYACFVQQTDDGGYIIAGYTFSFGAGGDDFWLVKTDGHGNLVWNRTYGGPSYEWAGSAQQTMDGGYVIAGYTQSFGSGCTDFWLVKTDSYGNAMWNRTYGGKDWDAASCVKQTSDGGYLLAGYTQSFGAGKADFWLVKTSEGGNVLWNKTYGGVDDDYARSGIQTSDEGYLVVGRSMSFGAGDDNIWLVKTDSYGNAMWNQTYGGCERDWVGSVQQTQDGGFIVAGTTFSLGAGESDFWLIKIAAYTLTLSSEGRGTTLPRPGVYVYPAGTDVEVRALPEAHYVLHHWEINGKGDGTVNPLLIRIDQSYVVRAVFTSQTSSEPSSSNAWESLILYLASVLAVVTVTVILFVRRHERKSKEKTENSRSEFGRKL